MKKIILLLLLVLVSVTASARKSYITVTLDDSDGWASKVCLTGDVPVGIAGFVYDSSEHYWVCEDQYSAGEILNVLSGYGYEVEYMERVSSFLLSKEISSGQTVSEGDVNKDGEVNISDVNRLVDMILGFVREHPEILKQIRK